MVIQDQCLPIRNYQVWILKNSASPANGFCGATRKSIDNLISEWSMLTSNEYINC